MGGEYSVFRGGEIALPEKLDVFGVGISCTDDYDQVTAQVVRAAHDRRPLVTSALSAHALMLAATQPAMAAAIARADVVTADGQPVRWAMNLLHGAQLSERVCGPELMLRVCEAAALEQLPVFFYGSVPSVLRPLVHVLENRFPRLRIAGVHPSRLRPRRFPPDVDEDADRADIERIARSGARIVFVGLGCPLQEIWTTTWRERLGMPALCVGAAFDFHAGLKRRAPALMQRLGLEWLYRLAQEPRRLAHRYAKYNSLFLWYLARALLRRPLGPRLGARRA